jgi:hypothetical protein
MKVVCTPREGVSDNGKEKESRKEGCKEDSKEEDDQAQSCKATLVL